MATAIVVIGPRQIGKPILLLIRYGRGGIDLMELQTLLGRL